MKIEDTFRGDTDNLRRSIKALIELDEAKALVPHGIGGHAKGLLSAAYVRLSTPPGRPTRGEIALALVNEYRRFMRLDAIDKLTDLPEHLYRDQLRYADVILSLLRPATSGEDIEAACMAFWNATADEFNQWANLSGEEQDGVRVGMGAAIRALGASA